MVKAIFVNLPQSELKNNMKKIFITTLVLCTIIIGNSAAQQISAEAYNTPLIHEDFNTEGEYFPITTTTDNYFIIDKGDYLLSRNNSESEYAILAKQSSIEDFILKTAIRIGPSDNKKASCGVILKAQQDGKGAIIFEINKKGEYRIKQLLDKTYKYLSGSNKQEGWKKSNLINNVDEHNFIEIRSEDNVYDLYINNFYLTTFFVPDYLSGSCGLIISAETKARVNYFYLNTKGEQITTTSTLQKDPNLTTVQDLNKKILTLEKNNAELNKLNNQLRKSQEVEISKINSQNSNLESENTELKEEIANLKKTNNDLKEKANKTDDLENTINENANLITTLNSDITSLNSKITDLKTKNSDLATISVDQEKEIKKLNSNISTFNSSTESLKTKNNELNNKISNLTNKNAELNTLNNEQKNKINSLTSNNSSLKNKNSDLANENSKLKTDSKSLKEQITLEKSISTDLRNDVNNAKKSAKTNSSKLKSEVSVLQKSLKEVKKENTNLTAELAAEKVAHKQTKNGLSKTIKTKTSELEATRTKLNTTEQQLASAKKSSASAKECAKDASKLKNDLKKATQEINALQKIKNQHDDKVDNLNNQISTLSAKQIELTTNLKAANEKAQKLETTNSELKELFILKDFEVNGVKPSDLIKQTTTYPTPKEIKNNKTIYAVQFGVYMQVQPYSSLKGLDDVWYETTEHGTYIYLSGQFTNPQEATNHKNKVAELGFPNAFVVTLTK